MRTVLRFLIPLALLVGLLACGSHDASHTEDPGVAGHDDHPSPAGMGSNHGLQLDGDEKWEMDKHTRAVFATMAGRLDGLSVDASGAPAWQQTGTVLRKDITELIAGCTMQGPAHDELHKFLTLYIPAVDELAASGGAESAAQVQELLGVYPRYFE